MCRFPQNRQGPCPEWPPGSTPEGRQGASSRPLSPLRSANPARSRASLASNQAPATDRRLDTADRGRAREPGSALEGADTIAQQATGVATAELHSFLPTLLPRSAILAMRANLD